MCGPTVTPQSESEAPSRAKSTQKSSVNWAPDDSIQYKSFSIPEPTTTQANIAQPDNLETRLNEVVSILTE